MRNLPSWYPDPAETKPAPDGLLLVQGLLNTRSLDEGTDVLSDPPAANAWLLDAGFTSPGRQARPAELRLAREVRESIRALLEAEGHGVPPESALGPLRDLAATHSARLTVGDRGELALSGARRQSLADRLFELLLIIRAAQGDGTWARLKACDNPGCRWVFYDRSRNQQGSWCDMAVCGNRLKNRRLRARRAQPAAQKAPS
jgi:predicted RNA-binding Zn ribbon-like protein